MKKDEIAKYADTTTFTNQRTILFFHDTDDNNGMVGYFDNNADQELRNKNQWNFVRTPIIDEENKYSIINGEIIRRIEIKKI
jgi:hypothetical protein